MAALLGVTAGFFLLLEGALRLFGVGFPVQFFIASPAGQPGVLVENQEFSRRYFSRPLMRIPQSEAFTREKAAGTLRVFVFGESAAEGDPNPSFGFARMLRVLLEDRYPGRRIEVINTAVTAINSHVIRPIAQECTGYGGDVWVVYMGNNEVVGPFGSGTVFGPQAPSLGLIRANIAVKSTRIGQAMDQMMSRQGRRGAPKEWGGMEMFLGQQVALADLRTTAVYAHFQANLSDIVAAGTAAGVKVVLSTVGSNLRDCPPFASLHRPGLSAGDIAEWDRLYRDGSTMEDAGTPEKALEKFAAAERIDDRFAELHFRMARCLATVGKHEEALRHFVLARDLDTLRFRCDSKLNEITRELAAANAKRGVRLADAEAAFRARTPDGVPGREWFHEHVHLTVAGNYLIALEMAKQVVQSVGGDVKGGSTDAGSFLALDECGARLALSDFDRVQMASEMASRVSRPPFTHQLGHDADVARRAVEVKELRERARSHLSEALAIYEKALARSPSDWRLHDNLAGILLQTGNHAKATEQWREVMRLLPHRVQSYDLVGSVLLEAGKFDEAAAEYQRALEIRPDYSDGLIGLGRARSGLNRWDEAIALFRRAVELKPDASGLNHLGLALLRSGRTAEAIKAFQESARIDPTFVPARLNLGNALSAAGKPGEAITTYRDLIKNLPDNTAARLELAKALNKAGRGDEALVELREGARLHPDDFETRQALANAWIKLQRFDEASGECAAALALNPDSFECHLNFGTILARQGHPDQARVQFEEAVRLKPDFVPARLNAAMAWIDLGNSEMAEKHLQEALRIEPGNQKAKAMLDALMAGPRVR